MPISERRMFEIWRQINSYKSDAQEIAQKIKKRSDALLAEFERRGLKGIEDKETGERITFVQSESVAYNQDELKDQLRKSKKGREILARCTVEVLDMQAIAAEVQAGNIPPKIVAKCSAIKKSAPYLRGGGRPE